MDLYIPSRSTKHRYSDKPWFNVKCHDAVQDKQKAYKNWQKTRTRELWILNMDAKAEYQQPYAVLGLNLLIILKNNSSMLAANSGGNL